MENFLPEIVFVFLGAVTRWSRQSGALHQPKARRRSIASRYQRAGDGSVVAAVGRALAREAKVYWICPMVEESETADLAAVEERYKALAPPNRRKAPVAARNAFHAAKNGVQA